MPCPNSASTAAAAQHDWIDRFEDQTFSLTDAVSFAIMTERRITTALALDRHFRVAGFEVAPGDR